MCIKNDRISFQRGYEELVTWREDGYEMYNFMHVRSVLFC